DSPPACARARVARRAGVRQAPSPSWRHRIVIYDHRTYTCRPGTIKKHLALYEQHGYAVQRKHLGDPVLYAVTETGDVNPSVHVWAYEDAADRARKRAALQADPAWIAFLEK